MPLISQAAACCPAFTQNSRTTAPDMFIIQPQHVAHEAPIEALLDAAFGPGRQNRRSYGFRDGLRDIRELRFVALDGEILVGTIRFWPIVIGRTATPALLLGPLGVSPDRQDNGIGAALVKHGLTMAREHGHTACALVGPLHYYGRFGFAPASVSGVSMPGEQQHRLLLRELQNGALNGVSGDIKRADETYSTTSV